MRVNSAGAMPPAPRTAASKPSRGCRRCCPTSVCGPPGPCMRRCTAPRTVRVLHEAALHGALEQQQVGKGGGAGARHRARQQGGALGEQCHGRRAGGAPLGRPQVPRQRPQHCSEREGQAEPRSMRAQGAAAAAPLQGAGSVPASSAAARLERSARFWVRRMRRPQPLAQASPSPAAGPSGTHPPGYWPTACQATSTRTSLHTAGSRMPPSKNRCQLQGQGKAARASSGDGEGGGAHSCRLWPPGTKEGPLCRYAGLHFVP